MMPSMPELLIILAIVLLLFGAKKIPEFAKGLGRGIKDFKKEMSEDEKASVEKIEKEEKAEEVVATKVEKEDSEEKKA